MKIMTCKQTRGEDGKMKERTFTYNVSKFCDPNVYKLEKEQKMRHVLSDKFYRKDDPHNKLAKGNFLDQSFKPHQFMMAIRGNEKEIPFAVLDNIFKLTETDEKMKKEVKPAAPVKKVMKKQVEEEEEDEEEKPKRSHHKKQVTVNDLEFEEQLIKLEKDELIELLNNFDIDTNTILSTIAPLYHSPYPKEWLIKVVSEWYEQVEHDHPENVKRFIDYYYEQENTNKWFFSLINKLDAEQKDEYKAKYCKQCIDWSIDINNSNITYQDVKKRTYTLPGIANLFNDLRGCVGVIDDMWYLKTTAKDEDESSQKIIVFMNEEKLMRKLKTFKPFRGNSNINLYQIVAKFSNMFHYEKAMIMKENKEGYINMFQGFKYEEIQTDDFTIINDFLKHIEHVICNDDKAKYDYYMK